MNYGKNARRIKKIESEKGSVKGMKRENMCLWVDGVVLRWKCIIKIGKKMNEMRIIELRSERVCVVYGVEWTHHEREYGSRCQL